MRRAAHEIALVILLTTSAKLLLGCQTTPPQSATFDHEQPQGPEKLARWFAENFHYNYDRLIQTTALWNARPGRRQRFTPISYEQFLKRPHGICADLTHFAVESLKKSHPELKPFYLRLDRMPENVRGHRVSRHWMAGFIRKEGMWFFADSSRPGSIVGPYREAASFVAEYSRYRGHSFYAPRIYAQNPFEPGERDKR